MTLSFATIRFFAVIRQTVNAPVVLRCPQKWVKPKNVKVSGFPSPRCFRFRAANRQTQSAVSCQDVIPNRTSPAVPEIVAGTAQHPFGIESQAHVPRQDGTSRR